jgi:hypothetical protein
VTDPWAGLEPRAVISSVPPEPIETGRVFRASKLAIGDCPAGVPGGSSSMTRGSATRLVSVAAVAAAIAATALLVLRPGDERIRGAPPREPSSDDRAAAGAPRVCVPLADSPELILLAHRSRGRYCMW